MKDIGFQRTPNGVRVVADKFTVHLTYEEMERLRTFTMSGANASTAALRKAMNRREGNLQAFRTAELEKELERRGVLLIEDGEVEDEADQAESL